MKKKTVFRLLHTDNGRYAISFILGLGLASLFKKVCSDRNCIVLAAPPFEEVTKNIYEYNNKCYKFEEKLTKCDSSKQKVSFINKTPDN